MIETRRPNRPASPGGSAPRRAGLAAVLLLASLWAAACAPPVPPQPAVLLVGIDGASWTVMGPMLERGELPSFARLREEGAHTPRFETLETTHSPLVWTSVATGRVPEDHGITSYFEILPNGRTIPVSSSSRKVKAIWNLASEHGRSVGVINWWASWPAEPVQGYVVTDHANPSSIRWLQRAGRDKKWLSASPSLLRSLQSDAFPEELILELTRFWVEPEAYPYDEVQRRGGFSPAQIEMLRPAPWGAKTVYSSLKTFFAVDYAHHRIAKALLAERPTDLAMVYFRGPDPIQHHGWDLVQPEKFARKPPQLERDRGLVEGTYRYIDGFLGELLDAVPESTTVIVLSDHGAEASEKAGRFDFRGRPGEHSSAAKGVLFLRGPQVRRGHRIGEADPLDILPTLAWLLGLPVAEELPGRILGEAFLEDFVGSQEIRKVASYGGRPVRTGLPSEVDEVMLEQLRGLGYIE